jgi:superfamily II DNA or RNA helicase
MKIKLRDYQQEAVNFAKRVKRCLFCMRVGSGKTVCAMFALRAFFKEKLIDKAVVACTKSSVPVFVEDFKEKANIDVPVIEDENEFVKFFKNKKDKVCVVKHSMFEKAGNDIIIVKKLEQIYDSGTKVALVIDEAHKMQNPEGVQHDAYFHIEEMFDRVILMTATPYSSCLSQFYGLIHLIYPKLWKSKRQFFDNYIEEITIKDPKTFRVVRKEKVAYKNLKEFRKRIEPFTYFYYPPIALVHQEHKCKLSEEHYRQYLDFCWGIMDEKSLEKLENKKK